MAIGSDTMTHGKKNNEKQIKIFLSRAAEDREFAAWIRMELNNNGFTVFDFENDQRPGDWVEKLSSELNNCNCAVLVISEKWNESDWCKTEANALCRRKYDRHRTSPLNIIPIYLVPMTSITVNLFIGSETSVDFSSTASDDRKTALTSLVRMLSEPIPKASPLQRLDTSHKPNPKGTSPFVVFLSLLLLLLSLPIAARTWSLWNNKQHFNNLRRTQEIVQKIDERVERLIAQGVIPAPTAFSAEDGERDFEIKHIDPDSSLTLAIDEFVNGILTRRWLYKEGIEIAKDEYTYYSSQFTDHDSVPKVKEKERTHINDQSKPYLVDLFSPPKWRLVNKQDCIPGQLYNCSEYVLREPPSPPPETVYLQPFYQLPIYYR